MITRKAKKDLKLYFLWKISNYILTVGFVLFSFSAYNQIKFSDQTSLNASPTFVGTPCKAVCDMNDDGLDDIVRCEFPSGIVQVLYQQIDGSFKIDSVGIQADFPLSVAIGDINNDKKNDFIIGGAMDGLSVRYKNITSGKFELQKITSPLVYIQGSNFSDINNDGFLDFFACNDTGINQIWQNMGGKSFNSVNDWIDFKTVPTSDNSGNYAAVWSDIDNDGDLDFYIGKCSRYAQGSTFKNDPRRINQLFINKTYSRVNGKIVKNSVDFTKNPSGWFTENAANANVKISDQSWTVDFADIDNDGDQDLFVTNHEGPSVLLENNSEGVFTDITTKSNIANILVPLQAIMRDFDNDGFVDLIVCGGSEGQIWKNNGDKTFTKQMLPFGSMVMESFAVGDLNHDGFYDVYASYNVDYFQRDKLFINKKNQNHYTAITLEGIKSNKNGIGAKVELIRKDGMKITKEVKSGDGYEVNNSFTQIFGLGINTEINSIKVYWPSGTMDSFVTPNIGDSFVVIKEGACLKSINNESCNIKGQSTISMSSSCNCMSILELK